MVTGKDFYGGTVTDAIADACQEFSTSQEGLDIEILETGSSGIFGLCRKKAHIRAAKKGYAATPDMEAQSTSKSTAQKDAQESSRTEQKKKSTAPQAPQGEVQGEESTEKTAAQSKTARENSRKNSGRKNTRKPTPRPERRSEEALPPPELPSDEVLAGIQEDISSMLS
ncbi:MAG: hypothetical protein D3908_03200, partial [Candidatus Electrothrix sp. AUS4]|nr:hypothetical protein [Candidatus Electrothrix sp. AUS4]